MPTRDHLIDKPSGISSTVVIHVLSPCRSDPGSGNLCKTATNQKIRSVQYSGPWRRLCLELAVDIAV